METDSNNLDIAFERFNRFLEQFSYRKTPERFSILRKIIYLNSPFQVETLFQEFKSEKFSLSKATLYNTIHLLERAGLIRYVWYGKSKRYELNLQNDNPVLFCYQGNNEVEPILDRKKEKEIVSIIEKWLEKKISKAIFYIREEHST